MPNAINGIVNTPGTPPASNAKSTSSRELGKNEFLKLLTTQLANQDPLAPSDNQAFIAQLAQFASVEQAEATNSRLDALIMAQAASNQTSVATLVGKNVTYKTDSVKVTPGTSSLIQGDLARDAKQVNAIITDQNGTVIRTLTMQNVKAGTIDFNWDGRNDRGDVVALGTYKVKLTAADEHDKSITFESRASARATGVTFQAGFPELILNGVRVKLSDIIQINEATPTSPTATTAA